MRYTFDQIEAIAKDLERSVTDPETGELNYQDARADITTEDVCRARNALLKVFHDYENAVESMRLMQSKFKRIVDSYEAENPARLADFHPQACECLRCAVDAIR